MKKLGFGLLVILMGIFTQSCDDSDGYSLDDMWITIGNIEGDAESYVIVTDGGTRLFPSATAVPDYGFEDGDRMFINFTILSDGTEESGINHYIKLNGYREILTKGLIELNKENADSIGNDPIWFSDAEEDIWISNNYLNVDFIYEGAPWITHYINLVSDIDNPTNEDGIPVFEIRHNANDDPYTEPPLRAFVSFDLTELQEPGQSEITFIIKSTGRSESENFEKQFTYTFLEKEPQALQKMNMENISDSVE
ncbi:NigD1/NigD2 family lipoprotein [Carboxylicivirga linearis]|uniref:NigD-like N-terminal domain-containing protein n=1 Tax=Carboxylicivirga linearis TaxID=1628157 RepID=A0ABS5JX66_9BACT|nr:NigD-like C-terminal domain-containing protein [Carboxylicivirga linearis]MBS2099501.1 NigD-like N-terminal domain-containing protein [Carboxylicivirga linearis]